MERPTLPLSGSLDSLFNELPALKSENGYQRALSPRTNQVFPDQHVSSPPCFSPYSPPISTAQKVSASPSPPPPLPQLPKEICYQTLFSMSPYPDLSPQTETGKSMSPCRDLPLQTETGKMDRESISTSVKKETGKMDRAPTRSALVKKTHSPYKKRTPDALAASPSKIPKLVGYSCSGDRVDSKPEPSILKCGLPVRFTYVDSSIMNSSVKKTDAETYQQIFLKKLTLNEATSFKNADIPYFSTQDKPKEKIYLLEIYKAVLESDPHTVVILKRNSGGNNKSNKNNQNGIVSDSYRHCKISGSSSPQENATHKNSLRKQFKNTALMKGHILLKIHFNGEQRYHIVIVSQ
ncbi:MAG: hypothetical protein VW378_07405 [bacterium]